MPGINPKGVYKPIPRTALLLFLADALFNIVRGQNLVVSLSKRNLFRVIYNFENRGSQSVTRTRKDVTYLCPYTAKNLSCTSYPGMLRGNTAFYESRIFWILTAQARVFSALVPQRILSTCGCRSPSKVAYSTQENEQKKQSVNQSVPNRKNADDLSFIYDFENRFQRILQAQIPAPHQEQTRQTPAIEG